MSASPHIPLRRAPAGEAWLPSERDEPGVQDERRAQAPIKGRGTATQVSHRFQTEARARQDDGWAASTADGSAVADGEPAAPTVRTQLTLQDARSILSRNDSPDVPFELAINSYRGCEHGCIYCYARPTHSYLNLSPGLDFETQILGKVNGAALLRRELSRPGHVPSPINLGSATDPYQPLEREARLTREVLEVLDACRHPFTIVTKSALVTRDIDILARAAKGRRVQVLMSLTTLDNGLSRVLEPRAASGLRRLQAIRQLAEAGVPVGVNVAPIIPFVNEPEIENLIAAAAAAGARSVHFTVLRLPWEVRPLFEEWLQHHMPLKAARVLARLRDLGDGEVYSAGFGRRMKGRGVWADLIAQRVGQAAARHGLAQKGVELDGSAFAVPAAWQARPVVPPLAPQLRSNLASNLASESNRPCATGQQSLF
jgi:DNA repair photolyase